MDDLPGTATADAIVDRDALERAFASLSTEHRAVVVLHHYLGLGLDEIAAIVGVPHGTARSRLHYALQKLRSTIEADRATDRRGRGVRDDEREPSKRRHRPGVGPVRSRAGLGRPRRTDAPARAPDAPATLVADRPRAGVTPGPGRCRGPSPSLPSSSSGSAPSPGCGGGRSSGADAGPGADEADFRADHQRRRSRHRDLHRRIRPTSLDLCTHATDGSWRLPLRQGGSPSVNLDLLVGARCRAARSGPSDVAPRSMPDPATCGSIRRSCAAAIRRAAARRRSTVHAAPASTTFVDHGTTPDLANDEVGSVDIDLTVTCPN